MHITDILVFKPVCGTTSPEHCRKLTYAKYKASQQIQLDTSHLELVELVKHAAVEHLTTSRQLKARKFDPEFGFIGVIITTDYEALYAYKRGQYQRCLQLSTENVHTLIDVPMSAPVTLGYSEFIQLTDDDTVSLIGLMLIVKPSCRDERLRPSFAVSQFSLSLYLMTQCHMKLHHSVTSVAQSLNYIEVARQKAFEGFTLEQLLLKFAERKILRYISVDSK